MTTLPYNTPQPDNFGCFDVDETIANAQHECEIHTAHRARATAFTAGVIRELTRTLVIYGVTREIEDAIDSLMSDARVIVAERGYADDVFAEGGEA